MTAYVALFLIGGPWGDVSNPSPHGMLWQAPGVPALVAAFLAWRVTRGSRFSRCLIIFFTVIGALAFINSGGIRSGSLASFGFLGIYVVQIGLMLSAPIYNRTRREEDREQEPVPCMWVTPSAWLLAAGAAGGVIMTLLYLGNMSPETVRGCEASNSGTGHVAASADCTTLAEGYPVHFLSAAPFLTLDPGQTVKVADIGVFADPVIDKGACAADFATWAVVSFLALYMLQLPSRRTTLARAVNVPPGQAAALTGGAPSGSSASPAPDGETAR
jgi:hypothetical protein